MSRWKLVAQDKETNAITTFHHNTKRDAERMAALLQEDYWIVQIAKNGRRTS